MKFGFGAGFVVVAMATSFPTAEAQSTDGFHGIQVFPVVVDTASYRTRLTFSNPSGSSQTLRAYYLPAEGTSQPAELDCGNFTLAKGEARTFESIREVCPGLAAGGQFGTLHTMLAEPVPYGVLMSYAAYSRVENPQGIGFSVEAFPAHTLTGADVEIAGLRRQAATAASPAYQTNCFVGSIHHEQSNTTVPGTTVWYEMFDSQYAIIASGSLEVPPGKMVRILDMFAHAGLPAGDYDNVRINFYKGLTPAVVAFCTVQDNTSFSADFRIGKQRYGYSVAEGNKLVALAQDDHVNRRTYTSQTLPLADGSGAYTSQPFAIPASGASNTHVIQARSPDWLSCDIAEANGGPMAGKLELRLLRVGYPPDGATIIAGGNDAIYFGPVYLGDKYGYATSNSRYLVEVEGREPGAGVEVPYMLRCRSGSGHSQPDLVRSGGPNLF